MVRLGVVSDSHNSQFWLERFAAKCAKAQYDCVFHLGDLYEDARWLEKHIDRPLIAVTGNCDYFTKRGAPMARASFGGRQIIAVHGHMQNVKYTPLGWAKDEVLTKEEARFEEEHGGLPHLP